ncbi:hypothetical protein C7379_10478 [Hallella colorans]|uniref:Uncharacterized protein n=1 Tax=Hallella colorans TaxID=1703337 RepID=A0A2U0UIH3_9BACT|nr:hypothetical protein C7379_10478 [Hallella colorans]
MTFFFVTSSSLVLLVGMFVVATCGCSFATLPSRRDGYACRYRHAIHYHVAGCLP